MLRSREAQHGKSKVKVVKIAIGPARNRVCYRVSGFVQLGDCTEADNFITKGVGEVLVYLWVGAVTAAAKQIVSAGKGIALTAKPSVVWYGINPFPELLQSFFSVALFAAA